MSKENNKVALSTTIGVLSIFLLINASFVVNPMLASLAKIYEADGISYSTVLYLSTLVSLMVIPFSLIGGSMAGKKIKYKTLAILASLLVLVGGVGPVLFSNFYAVLACRALVGAGIGIASPLGSALVSRVFKGNRIATMQGIGTAINNVAGVVYQILAGIVCSINVRATWFIYLIALVPLVCAIFFVKEPEPEEVVAQTEVNTSSSGKKRLPAMVFLISIAWGLIFMAYNPMGLNMASIVTGEGLGTEAVSGTIGSFYTVGGVVAGLIFGALFKAIRKMTIPFAILCEVIGLLLGYFGGNVPLLIIGSFLTGFAIFTIWPASIMDFTEALPADQIAAASGVFTACLGLGGFLTSPYVAIITSVSGSDSPRLPILVGAVLTAVIGVFWTIYELRKKPAKAELKQ